MKFLYSLLLVFLLVSPALGDSVNVVSDGSWSLLPDSDYSCSIYLSVWEAEGVDVWGASVAPSSPVVVDSKRVLVFDMNTFLNLDCRTDENGLCGFYFVTAGSLSGADIVECHPKLEKNNVEMLSLMLGGLFGIAFVMAALWRF